MSSTAFAPSTGAGTPSVSTPAPATVSSYDFPGGDVYVSAQNAANTAYEQSLAQLNQQRGQTLNNYGYTGTVNPTTGALSNVAVDPNNPYGQYQQLLSNSAKQSMSDENAAAARGVSGGLAQQAQTADKQAYGQGAFTLGTNLQNTLSGYDNSQVTAENQRDQSIISAQEQAAASALQYQLAQALATGPVQPVQPVQINYPGDPGNQQPYAPGGSSSSNPGSGSTGNGAANIQYASTPVGKTMVAQVNAHPGSAGSSGAAQTLLAAAKKKNVPNYQAARDAV